MPKETNSYRRTTVSPDGTTAIPLHWSRDTGITGEAFPWWQALGLMLPLERSWLEGHREPGEGRPMERQEQGAASTPCPPSPSTHLKQCHCSGRGLLVLFGERMALPWVCQLQVHLQLQHIQSRGKVVVTTAVATATGEKKITESPKMKRSLKSYLGHPPFTLSKGGSN